MFQSSESNPFLYKSKPESFSSEDNSKELEQTFELIDSFLSLRHCLFYQVLPLELNNNCLVLGMVNLENQQALKYLESLVAEKNYSLNKKQIDWQTFQSIVLAYSSHSRANRKEKNKIDPVSSDTKIARSIEQLKNKLVKQNPLQDRPTLIISSPKQLKIENSLELSIEEDANISDKKTVKAEIDNSRENIPSLEVQAIYLETPAEFLTTLSPQLLWRELLGRMLGVDVGVAKLRFERQQDFGRIVLSQNAREQLFIDKIDLQLFQSVLSELKYLAKLPISSLQELRRGELLRCYKEDKLLLSWQIHPNQFGEEATLHVLRGSALKFYQQKQMDDLGEQALQLAKTLESKLHQIQTLKAMNSSPIRQLTSIRQSQVNISRYLRSTSNN